MDHIHFLGIGYIGLRLACFKIDLHLHSSTSKYVIYDKVFILKLIIWKKHLFTPLKVRKKSE